MSEAPRDDEQDSAMRDLVKRALSKDDAAKNAPDILRGVQRRLRKRSRGKFFADGWSTMHTRFGYLLVATITVLLVALAYFALGPIGLR
jgi:hypothetical protein